MKKSEYLKNAKILYDSGKIDADVYDAMVLNVDVFCEEDSSHHDEKTIVCPQGFGKFHIGEYSIAGNYFDGYTVWKTEDGEDSDTLYDSLSFEDCVLWCLDN